MHIYRKNDETTLQVDPNVVDKITVSELGKSCAYTQFASSQG